MLLCHFGEILAAFDGSDTLVVEVDISGENEQLLRALTLEYGSYPAGMSIRDELSPETWRDLEKALLENGLPIALMERLRGGQHCRIYSSDGYLQERRRHMRDATYM